MDVEADVEAQCAKLCRKIGDEVAKSAFDTTLRDLMIKLHKLLQSCQESYFFCSFWVCQFQFLTNSQPVDLRLRRLPVRTAVFCLAVSCLTSDDV